MSAYQYVGVDVDRCDVCSASLFINRPHFRPPAEAGLIREARLRWAAAQKPGMFCLSDKF